MPIFSESSNLSPCSGLLSHFHPKRKTMGEVGNTFTPRLLQLPRYQ